MNRTDSLWPALTRLVSQKEGDNSANPSFDAFLASVEQRAFIMAKYSTHDKEAALDIVQDCMLQMVQKYAGKPETEWPPLFFRILANRLTDHHRKRGFARMLRWRGISQSGDESVSEPVDQLQDQSPTPELTLDCSQINLAVRSALMQLPERQRQVFTLRQWQGLSVAETAQSLGISNGSVKTHLSRAIQTLRFSLKEYASNES